MSSQPAGALLRRLLTAAPLRAAPQDTKHRSACGEELEVIERLAREARAARRAGAELPPLPRLPRW